MSQLTRRAFVVTVGGASLLAALPNSALAGTELGSASKKGQSLPKVVLTKFKNGKWQVKVEKKNGTKTYSGTYTHKGTLSSGDVTIKHGGTKVTGDLVLQAQKATLDLDGGAGEVSAQVAGVDDAALALGFLLAISAIVVVAAFGGSTGIEIKTPGGFEIKATLETEGAAGDGKDDDDQDDDAKEGGEGEGGEGSGDGGGDGGGEE